MQHYQLRYMLTVWIFNLGRLQQKIKHELTRLKLRRRGSFIDSSWFTLALKPIWERERVKVLVGAPLMAAVMMGNGIATPQETATFTQDWSVNQPIQNILTSDILPPNGDDAITYQLPVTTLTGISQFFHPGHPGVDLRAPIGTPVKPMETGTVLAVRMEPLGYGKNILVSHGHGLVTRYAHLNAVYVREEQQVGVGQTIGLVGMTGWSTGPHLHFEVMEEGTAVNPLTYLYKALAVYQTDHQIRNESGN